MKPQQIYALATFPVWGYDFTTIAMDARDFIKAVRDQHSELTLLPSGICSDIEMKVVGQALKRCKAKNLSFTGLDYEENLFIVLANLNQHIIEHLNFNAEYITAEMLAAIIDLAIMVNANNYQLKSLELSWLTWSVCQPTQQIRIDALNRLFNLQYCPAITFRWCYLEDRHFASLDFGNCRKLLILQVKWSSELFDKFMIILRKSKITHLEIGELTVTTQVSKFISILPQTKIIALRLQLRNVPLRDEIFKLLSISQLRYLSVSHCPTYDDAIRQAIERSRCRYIRLGNLKIDESCQQLSIMNLSLCGFDDNLHQPPFLHRNVIIQSTIRQCAYTLLMIKRYRSDSIFSLIDVNVVKMIAAILLDGSHELIWLNLIT